MINHRRVIYRTSYMLMFTGYFWDYAPYSLYLGIMSPMHRANKTSSSKVSGLLVYPSQGSTKAISVVGANQTQNDILRNLLYSFSLALQSSFS